MKGDDSKDDVEQQVLAPFAQEKQQVLLQLKEQFKKKAMRERLEYRLQTIDEAGRKLMPMPLSGIVNVYDTDIDVLRKFYEDNKEILSEGFIEGNALKEYAKKFFCWVFGIEYTPKRGINAPNKTGHAPLHIIQGNLPLQKIFVEELGADVNIKDANGATPIFYVAATPFIDTLKHLVEHGAKTDVTNNNGQNPLHTLVKDHNPAANRDLLESAKYLIDQGVNLTQKDKSGKTPLDLIKEKHESQQKEESNQDQYNELFELYQKEQQRQKKQAALKAIPNKAKKFQKRIKKQRKRNSSGTIHPH